MKTFALIGDPDRVQGSLSPLFQNAALKAAGVDAKYIAWAVHPEWLSETVAKVRRGELAGANVTIPYKESVLASCDRLAPEADRIRAVNWIARDEKGAVVGDNTDAEGLLRALREARVPAGGVDTVVLGAGGAARAAAWALARAGARRVTVGARRLEKAEAIARDLGSPAVRAVALEEARRLAAEAAVVVSAVPPEAFADVAPASIARSSWLVDLAYSREGTPAESFARQHGAQSLGGLPMLLHQGAISFEKWLGIPFPMDAAKAALAGG